MAIFYAVASVAAMSLVLTSPWSLLVGAGFAVHLAWQVRRLRPNDPALALRLFKSNRDAGLLLFAALALLALRR